ncbi:MAG TPA: helix-turn-helix domain-containing protein [Kribbella sp.]|jgi:transposase
MVGPGRPKAELVLSDHERGVLRAWADRPQTGQRSAFRARIVLSCAEGRTNQDVAAAVGTRPQTVAKWRGRFVRDRLDGLSDEPRPGRPRTVTDEQIQAMIAKAVEDRPPSGGTWSTRSLARATGLSQTAISRVSRWGAVSPAGPERQERAWAWRRIQGERK